MNAQQNPGSYTSEVCLAIYGEALAVESIYREVMDASHGLLQPSLAIVREWVGRPDDAVLVFHNTALVWRDMIYPKAHVIRMMEQAKEYGLSLEFVRAGSAPNDVETLTHNLKDFRLVDVRSVVRVRV